MFQKILVTLDGSELAERALAPAFSLAEKFGSEVILLRVPLSQLYVAVPTEGGMILPPDVIERDQHDTEAYLKAVRTKWSKPGLQIRTEAIPGRPASVIVEVAQKDAVDLIVMSTHGRSGVSRLLYGSVAESVLHGARMPLLLIPVKHED